MKTTSSMIIAVLLAPGWLGACKSSASQYSSQYVINSYWRNEQHPLLFHGSSYETMTHLDKDIALAYRGDKVPEEAVVIVHGKQLARSKNCVHATINALKKLQEDAKKLGANAIVNLEPTWEGETLRVDDKYFCAGGAVTFGIIWEGDFVKIGKAAASGGASASQGEDSGAAGKNGQPSPPPEEDMNEIIISVTGEGKIVYEDKKVSRDFILGILEERKKADPNVRIVLLADPDAPYGKIDEITEALAGAGFTNVKIQVSDK